MDQDPGVPNGNEDDKDEGDEDGILSFGFFLSIGIGYFVGFWGVCGTLLVKISWRNAYFSFYDDTKDWIYKRARAVFKPRLHRV